jgi:predicted DNA-binding protein with PD1-like motif
LDREKIMDSNSQEHSIVKTFFVQPDRDSELVSALNDLAREKDIAYGSFTAIGALRSARLAFYDQQTREYIEVADLDEAQELISCMGTITIREGKHYAHAHVVLVDAQGTTRAGHLLEAKVFFTQACVHKLEAV